MSDKPLPEKLQRRYKVNTVVEMWHKHLSEGNIRTKQWRHLFGMLPSNPRCVNCHTPFTGVGHTLLHLIRGPIAGVSGSAADFTALGDNVNIAARLASKAGAGEVLISDSTYAASGLDLGDLEQRQLELKGKSEPIRVRVMHIS